MAKTIFSGVQPSGQVHLGNYLGAMQQWVKMEEELSAQGATDFIFMLANLHSITVPQEPAELMRNTYDLGAWFLAAGLDPKKTAIFIQSQNSDHPYLGWMFDCITPMGWMERMTQYKDKSKKQGTRTSVGLFHYPNLMAADILLYDTDLVPVGEDQTQHVELARDVAQKFNATFGEVFVLPRVHLVENAARVMSLQNPLQKMSKSAADPAGTVNLLDSADKIDKKIMRAVTDSGTEVRCGEDKPALTNLIGIYSACAGVSIAAVEEKYAGKGYGEFKKGLSEVVVGAIMPIQKKFHEYAENRDALEAIFAAGLTQARARSSQKLQQARAAMGLI